VNLHYHIADDVLFDELTVEEHLRFFSLLKGLEDSVVNAEVNRMITALGLENKRNAQSHTLRYMGSSTFFVFQVSYWLAIISD